MNTYSMENNMAGMPTQFHNYDVLLMPSSGDAAPRFAPGNHVGNQRFRVLLSLFRQSYLQADAFGDEDEGMSIAQDMLDSLTRKCVPNGRIFEQGRDNKWHQLDSSSAIFLIQNALAYDVIEDEIERSPKRLCHNHIGFELLYKAASKDLPSQAQEFVESPAPFDVVCESSGRGVLKDSHYTGNNRLKIMLSLRMESYKTSSKDGKKTIAEDVVSSITVDASSRFLQKDKSTGKYVVVTRTTAIACILGALATVSGVEKKNYRESEVKKLHLRKQKKAILDKVEKKKGGKDPCAFSSCSTPPTRFHIVLPKHKPIVPRAA